MASNLHTLTAMAVRPSLTSQLLHQTRLSVNVGASLTHHQQRQASFNLGRPRSSAGGLIVPQARVLGQSHIQSQWNWVAIRSKHDFTDPSALSYAQTVDETGNLLRRFFREPKTKQSPGHVVTYSDDGKPLAIYYWNCAPEDDDHLWMEIRALQSFAAAWNRKDPELPSKIKDPTCDHIVVWSQAMVSDKFGSGRMQMVAGVVGDGRWRNGLPLRPYRTVLFFKNDNPAEGYQKHINSQKKARPLYDIPGVYKRFRQVAANDLGATREFMGAGPPPAKSWPEGLFNAFGPDGWMKPEKT